MSPLTDEGVLEAAEGITNQTLYIALHTGSPPTAANELSGGSYSRTSMLPDAWHNVGAQRRNQNALTLPTPTTNWQDPTHYGLWTAPQGGTCLMYAPISPDVAPPAQGSPVSFPAGMLKIGRGLGTTVNLSVSPTSLTLYRGGTIGAQLTASGGSGSYAYSRTSGPAWILVNPSTGAVTGTVPSNQTLAPVSAVLRATDSAGASADVTFTILVRDEGQPLTLTVAPSYLSVRRGDDFTAQLRPEGGDGNYRYRKEPDTRTWLTVDSSGLIRGQNVSRSAPLGELTATFTVSDGSNATSSAVLTINVQPDDVADLALVVSPSSLSVQQGQAVSALAVASGGSGQYAYSSDPQTIPSWANRLRVQSGGPQAGEILGAVPSDFDTGRLSPDPVFIVTDLGEGRNRATARATLALTVTAMPTTLRLNVDKTTQNANRDSLVTARLTAAGGTGPYVYTKTTSNLAWLKLIGRNISGRVPGNQSYQTYTETFKATDSSSATATVAVEVVITPTAVVFHIQNSIVPTAYQGTTITVQSVISGGVAPYTYTKLPGVPNWIRISTTGLITADIPGDAPLGAQKYSIRATDSRANHDDATLILIIERQMVVGPPTFDSNRNIDFPSDINSPTAMVNNGTHLWQINYNNEHAYAFDISGSGAPGRDTSREFDLVSGNTAPGGACSDGTHIWVIDPTDDKAYAYRINASGAPTYDSRKDFNLDAANVSGRAATISGRTLWIGDRVANKAFAYNIRTYSQPVRRSGLDFAYTKNNTFSGGMANNGTHIWVIDTTDDKAYAYRITGSRPVYDSSRDFDLAAASSRYGSATCHLTELWAGNFDGTGYAHIV